MNCRFYLLDLRSQAVAVQRHLTGRTSQEKVSWLANHGSLLLLPLHDPSSRQVYDFISSIEFRCLFFLDDDHEFVFFGDHTTYKIDYSPSAP